MADLVEDPLALGGELVHVPHPRPRGGDLAVQAVERELERFRPELERLLATGAFPRTAEFLARGQRLALPDDRFEAGLEWLLDGMAAMLAARPA